MLGFIVNPVSGNGRGKVVWRKLADELKSRNITYHVRQTSGRGEARNLTKELVLTENVKLVVAIGGDGTVNEVINGIYDAGMNCRFGHIAAGSGNDFARGHKLPDDPINSLEMILKSKKNETIDLLRMSERVAANAIGAGFDGEVAKTTNEASYKKWFNLLGLGYLSYIISVLRVLVSYLPCRVSLTVDETEKTIENVWFIAIANIPNYGGGMLICPNAVANDGVAEICVVSGASRWALLRAFPLIFSGAHVNHPAVRFFRGKQIMIDAARPLPVHADGEATGETPIAIEVLAGRQVICK